MYTKKCRVKCATLYNQSVYEVRSVLIVTRH